MDKNAILNTRNRILELAGVVHYALMNRLDVAGKFALLGLMSLVAIAVVVYGLFASLNLVISTLQRQLEGIALIKLISRTVQIIQQHSGISTGFLSGDAAYTGSTLVVPLLY